MNSLHDRQVTGQIKEMRALADSTLQFGSRECFEVHHSSITGVLEKYLTERCQRRERWAGQKVTREELEEYIREQRRKEGAA